MILTNEFGVEASVDRVWLLLNELENVIPCMPGAAYHGRDGDDEKVSMKIKIGAISSHFHGTARFLEKNEAAHVVVMRGTGQDHGGKASAVATVIAKLEPLSPDRTRVTVNTDLSITGRLAQFGGGVIADIASLLISQFTENLHQKIISRPSVVGTVTPVITSCANTNSNTQAAPVEEAPALDLAPMVAAVSLKYALNWVVLPVGLLLIGWLIGRSY